MIIFKLPVKTVQVLSKVIYDIRRSRDYSTVECSLVELSADIDLIYKDLTYDLEYSISRYRLAVIKQKKSIWFIRSISATS